MENTKKIKVIIVDDDPTVRVGLKANLCDENLQKEFNTPVEVLGDFSDDIGLFNYLDDAQKTKPDIILLDMKFTKNTVNPRPRGGIEITRKIREKFPNSIDIIIVSGEFDHPDDVKENIKKIIESNSQVIADAIDAGAKGFVSRNIEEYGEHLFRALRCIDRGEKYFFNAPVLKTIVAAFLQYVKQKTFMDPYEQAKFFNLDDIDLEHLKMIAEGKPAKEIAIDLAKAFNQKRKEYAKQAIDKRQEKIAKQLRVENKLNLILIKAVQEGLIDVRQINI